MLEAIADVHTWPPPIPTDRRQLANTVTSADIARVNVRTIYRWVRDNRVEWVRTPSGQLRIYVDTLLRKSPKG